MCKNLLYKTSDKKYREKYNKFLLLCERYNAKVIKFEYYQKAFGDFVVEVEYNGKTHSIITDRGDIYLNAYGVCDNSYHKARQDDTFTKVLEIVEKELFSQKQ